LQPECEKSELEDEYTVPQGETNPSECDPDSGCKQECKLEDGEPVEIFTLNKLNFCFSTEGKNRRKLNLFLLFIQPITLFQVCYCSPGYRMENDECLDVDECEIENGDCDEECHNKPGSYICKLGATIFDPATRDPATSDLDVI